MRIFACLLLIAGPVWADGDPGPLQIDLTRLVAEASGHDWNGDGLPDRLLMVISDSGDAVDLVTFMSNPQTGEYEPAEVVAAILPAQWPKAKYDLHSVAYEGSKGNYTRPVLYGGVGPISYNFTLRRDQGRWVIDGLRTYVPHRGDNAPPDCQLDYAAGVGKGDLYGDAEFDIAIGAPPVLAPYWWDDIVPDICRL